MIGYPKPLVMIDKIEDLSPNRLTASKCITSSDFFLQGHFPDYSVYPGVLLLEGIKQAAELMIRLEVDCSEGELPYAVERIRSRFYRPIRPGTVIVYHIERFVPQQKSIIFAGTGEAAGKVVIQASLHYQLSCGEMNG